MGHLEEQTILQSAPMLEFVLTFQVLVITNGLTRQDKAGYDKA